MPTFNTVTERITLKGHNGDEIEAYTARPSEPGRYPGVVVIHHLPGWDAWTREIVRKFADAGYNAISPHLFSRWLPGSEGELRKKAFETWGPPDPQVMGDIAASARYLKSQGSSNGKAGCIGFCSGGRQTLLFACSSSALDVAVDCWGGFTLYASRDEVTIPTRPVPVADLIPGLACPLMIAVGAEDTNPSPADADVLRERLWNADKDFRIEVFEHAGHAFFADYRPSYQEEAAEQLWHEVVPYLREHLSPSSG